MCQTRARSFSDTSFWPTQPLGLLRSRSNSAVISGGQGVRAVSTGFLSNVVRAMAYLLEASRVGAILDHFQARGDFRVSVRKWDKITKVGRFRFAADLKPLQQLLRVRECGNQALARIG